MSTIMINGYIVDDCDGTDRYGFLPSAMRDGLEKAGGGPVVVDINSRGGSISAQWEIINMMIEYPGEITTRITGMSASSAGLIFLYGDKRVVYEASRLMLHNSSTLVIGTASDMARYADILGRVDEIMVSKIMKLTKRDEEYVKDKMDKDWEIIGGQKIKEEGFATEVLIEAKKPKTKKTKEVKTPAAIMSYPDRILAAIDTMKINSVDKKREGGTENMVDEVKTDASPQPAGAQPGQVIAQVQQATAQAPTADVAKDELKAEQERTIAILTAGGVPANVVNAVKNGTTEVEFMQKEIENLRAAGNSGKVGAVAPGKTADKEVVDEANNTVDLLAMQRKRFAQMKEAK